MDIRKLQRAIVDGLEDVKAHNIVVFNTEHLSPLFERVIIASGTSNRQTKALASSVRETVKSRGLDVLRTEGEDNGEWIIVDCGAAVAHIMQPSIRDYYHLEEIWGGKAVKLKLGERDTRLPKAAEPDDEGPPAKAPAAKKAAATKAAAKKAAAKKAAAKKTAPRQAGAPARGVSARQAALNGPAAPKQTPRPAAPAKKAAAGRPAAKKAAPAVRQAKRAAPTDPAAARKAPARRRAAG